MHIVSVVAGDVLPKMVSLLVWGPCHGQSVKGAAWIFHRSQRSARGVIPEILLSGGVFF